MPNQFLQAYLVNNQINRMEINYVKYNKDVVKYNAIPQIGNLKEAIHSTP